LTLLILLDDLHNAVLVFGFTCASANVGYSRHKTERVTNRDDPAWRELNAIPNWRRVLSSLWKGDDDIIVDDRRFATPEHALRDSVIRCVDPKLADCTFPLASKSKVALSEDGRAAMKAKRIATLTPAQWKDWETRVKPVVKAAIMESKFRPGTRARAVLLATGDAELWSYAPRRNPFCMMGHMQFRDRIRHGI
jgi:predicted NAD-dependent protein-ADP-ribosyltransferase YbiA (DUF1768 family)